MIPGPSRDPSRSCRKFGGSYPIPECGLTCGSLGAGRLGADRWMLKTSPIRTVGAPGFEPGIIFCWKGNSPLDHVVYMVLDENPFKRLKGFSSSTIYTTWSSGEFPFQQNMIPGSNPGAPTVRIGDVFSIQRSAPRRPAPSDPQVKPHSGIGYDPPNFRQDLEGSRLGPGIIFC